MRHSIRYIGIILFVFWGWSVIAQNADHYWGHINDSSNRLQGKLMGKVYYVDALSNSYFLYPDDWLEGTVELVDGDLYPNTKLRLNVKNDELIAFNKNNKKLYTVEKKLVKSFTIEKNGITQKFVKLKRDKGSDKLQYFEELYSGDLKLLAFRYIYEHKVNPYTDKFGVMRDTEYRVRIRYFLSDKNYLLQRIAPKRSAFLNAFPEHKRAIKKLFRKNKLYLNNPNYMVQACQLLDEAGWLK